MSTDLFTPPEENLTQDEFLDDLKRRVKEMIDDIEDFRDNWPGDLLPCDWEEWMARFERHSEDNGSIIPSIFAHKPLRVQ